MVQGLLYLDLINTTVIIGAIRRNEDFSTNLEKQA